MSCNDRRRKKYAFWILWMLMIFNFSASAARAQVIQSLGAGRAMVQGDWLAWAISEDSTGSDLNGDGDVADSVMHLRNLKTGETTNLGLAGWVTSVTSLSSRWLVFEVSEQMQGAADLNGDGDSEDGVIHVHNLETGETTNRGLVLQWLPFVVTEKWLAFIEEGIIHALDLERESTTNKNLGFALAPWWFPKFHYSFFYSENWLAFEVSEERQGADLNGDGDSEDGVMHVHNLGTGESTNLRLACSGSEFCGAVFSSGRLLFYVSEEKQGADLNGDGDADDHVLHLRDLEKGQTRNLGLAGTGCTLGLSGRWLAFNISEEKGAADLNGDGDAVDSVVHVHDLETGEITNLQIGVEDLDGSGRWLTLETQDHFAYLVDLEALRALPSFLRGDCDGDGRPPGQVTDAVLLLSYNFLGGEEPPCIAACDADGDGRVQGQVTDAVYMLEYGFLGGTPPAPPFPRCGKSFRETDGALGCKTPLRCP